jgi:hypothetical protein
MDTKECSKCGEVKAADLFGKKAAAKDGLQSQCKPCLNSGARSAYRASPESQRARARARAAEVYSSPEEVARQRAKASQQRSEKTKRKASWANKQLIAAYYKEAKRLEELTGIKFHVDHIIPLQGDLVSGLHVETNLQLLPAHENQAKHNSFDPETFCA